MAWPHTINISSECKSRILNSCVESQISALNVKQLGYGDAVDHFTIYRPNPDFHMMLFTTDGLGQLETKTQNFRLEPGSMVFVPAGCANGFSISDSLTAHSDTNQSHWSVSWIMLDKNIENALTNNKEAKNKEASLHCSEYGSLLRHNIESLAIAIHADGLNDSSLQQMLIEQCQHIIRQSAEQKSNMNNVQMRLQHLSLLLNKQLSKAWSIEDMAARVHCSPAHLYRLCQQWLNQTPMQHLQTLRIERAKQLIQFSENSMQQISEQSGFNDLANFSRRFKLLVGKTPSQYRKYYNDFMAEHSQNGTTNQNFKEVNDSTW
jgi:AraC-like DNA-binding protein